MTDRRPRSARRRGFILIVVLWSVLIVGTLASHNLREAQLGFMALREERGARRLRLAAESAVAAIQAGLREDAAAQEEQPVDGPGDLWAWGRITERTAKQIEEDFPGVRLTVRVEAQNGRLSLGSPDAGRISRMLEYLGVTRLRARELADTLVAAAEDSESGAEGAPPENEPLPMPANLARLLRVPDVTPADLWGRDVDFDGQVDEREMALQAPAPGPRPLLASAEPLGLESFLTLGSPAKVNINLAPAAVLAGLEGFSADAAEECVEIRAGADGVEGTSDDVAFRSTDDLGRISAFSTFREVNIERVAPAIEFTSTVFILKVCARDAASGSLWRVIAAIERSEKGDRILTWYEDRGP